MKRKILICLAALALIAAAAAVVLYVRSAREFRAAFGDGHAKLVFKETSLGKTHPGYVPSTLTLHKKSRSLAYFATRGDKAVVVWNGAEGKPYDYDDSDWIRHDTDTRFVDGEMFDGSKWVGFGWTETHERERDNPLVFSPDGKHLAYAARRGGSTHVVFDGIESPEYSDVFYEITLPGKRKEVCSLIFSADGRHFAYAATRGDEWFAVVDGIEGHHYFDIALTALTFSRNGKRLAFIAESDDGGRFLFIDDVPEQAVEAGARNNITVFPDSVLRLFVAKSNETPSFIVDSEGLRNRGTFIGSGVPCAWPDMAFSPDSKRLAYIAPNCGQASVVLDGIEGKSYDEVRALTWSGDSRRFAFVGYTGPPFYVKSTSPVVSAKAPQKAAVVCDGVEGALYDDVASSEISFLPDGRLAYAAKCNGKQFVVVDGVEGPQYTAVEGAVGFFIRPDGAELLWVQCLDCKEWPPLSWLRDKLERLTGLSLSHTGRQRMSINGVRSAVYDEVSRPIFSKDGRHTAFLGKEGDRWFFVVDGKNRPRYPVPLSVPGSECCEFPDFLVEDKGEFKLVEVTVEPE